MAEQNGDTGSRDRATVALVSEKVDKVHALMEAGFTSLQRQLDLLAGVPAKLAEHEARLKNLENDSEYRRGPGLGHVLSAAALIVALAALAATFIQ